MYSIQYTVYILYGLDHVLYTVYSIHTIWFRWLKERVKDIDVWIFYADPGNTIESWNQCYQVFCQFNKNQTTFDSFFLVIDLF